MRKTPFFLLCTLCFIFSLFFIARSITKREEIVESNGEIYLEMWHVDTFEGGTGSRSSYLQSISRQYAKQTSVRVVVKTQTIMSCEQNFQNGIYPDLISYGNGLRLPYNQLKEYYTGNNAGDKSNGYAKPWCCGGYLLISRKSTPVEGVIISEQENTIPLLAYHLSGIKLQVCQTIDSKNAVYAFYGQKNLALLGTQRDLYRLQNKGIDLQIEVLCGYNDLFQYVSVLSQDGEKMVFCQAFIDYLTSAENANKLYKIGMLPCGAYGRKQLQEPLEVYNEKYWEYTTEELLPVEKLKKLYEMAKNYQENSESIKNALKRLK